MRFNGQYMKRLIRPNGEVEISFSLPYYSDKQKAQELEIGKIYRIEAVAVKDKRTLQQNALLWTLIHEIAQEINTNRATAEDEWDVYINLLENANAKSQVVAAPAEAYDFLQKNTRAVKVLNKFTDEQGREMWTYRLYDGSSKFDKEEMGKLIDLAMDMASALGIEVEI